MEIPQVSRRRASSVVTRQFIRNDPLPWNIKVNFEATTVAASKPVSNGDAAQRRNHGLILNSAHKRWHSPTASFLL
jgi:hypothetical protein